MMRTERGALLIEIIVVVVIIALLAGVYLALIRGRGGGEEEASTPKAAMDKARGVECAANLQQLRALMQMRQVEDGEHPAALDPSSAMSRCPVTDKPYSYDARTGRVWCTTPGHETF